MRIAAIHIKRFRGLESVSLDDCADLNVLIGRNNSGKSSVLSAIEIAFQSMRSRKLASLWRTHHNSRDEFCNKNTDQPFLIGITFNLSPQLNEGLRHEVLKETNGLEVAVEQIRSQTLISVIVAGQIESDSIALYIQTVSFGGIDALKADLKCVGTKLLQMSSSVGEEFATRDRQISSWRESIDTIDQLDRNTIDYLLSGREGRAVRRIRDYLPGSVTPDILNKLDEVIKSSESYGQYESGFARLKSIVESDVDELQSSETKLAFSVLSGSTKVPPRYVYWILAQLSIDDMIVFKEVRRAVGRDEASQILKFKTQRGGEEPLNRIKSTVKTLLGVTVDAFEPKYAARSRRFPTRQPDAEMDIDDFLVEANGAGIREALRIILDLELKTARTALIEEPEVHLHPGLERVLFSYLQAKSDNVQLFIATHSANFLDTAARQNVYLFTKAKGGVTKVTKVASEGDLLKVSEEVGLRPSTVLMFDYLIFVEGPSDEDILTELGKKVGINLPSTRTTFVQMGGASRFAHYAAEATLELLSRRQVKMFFLIDRDEKSDAEVKKLIEKIGPNAKPIILQKRELENYLLSPKAIARLLTQKSEHKGGAKPIPDVDVITAQIQEVAKELLEEVLQLRMGKKLLRPIYAKHGGTNARERLEAMSAEAERRAQECEQVEAELREELSRDWDRNAVNVAPGSMILDALLGKYGFRYRKELDGQRLASYIDPSSINPEIRGIIHEFSEQQQAETGTEDGA